MQQNQNEGEVCASSSEPDRLHKRTGQRRKVKVGAAENAGLQSRFQAQLKVSWSLRFCFCHFLFLRRH